MVVKNWVDQVIKQEEIDKYLIDGKDFINEEEIWGKLKSNNDSSEARVRAIIEKSLSITRLDFDETATLLNVKDEKLWEEMYEAAAEIKRRVYDNRIVFFAPLYCGNLCVNSCKYCGFRKENAEEERKVLNEDEIKLETKHILDQGHKRVIVVYGEHPSTDANYIAESMRSVYSVQRKSSNGSVSRIRRINVNAAPMSTDDLKMLKEVGIGTYQVFQETYNKYIYEDVHPKGFKS